MRFVDIVTSTTTAEYVKLIVSCLDYSSDDHFIRLVLHTAITSASEVGRKWATRFLSVLAEHDSQTFTDWGIKFLLGQLADPSAKVVRHAVRVLSQWIPVYPVCLPLLQKLRLDAFGDVGVLLRTHLYGVEKFVLEDLKEVRSAIELWKKEFNVKYVNMVEDDMKVALVNVKRSLDGYFARVSNDYFRRRGVGLPVHLYGQLALHESGRDLLLQSKEIVRLLNLLRDTPPNVLYKKSQEIKAAIFALAQVITFYHTGWGATLAAETITIICRFAEACPVLSVRGVAFWGLNLIGGCKYGAKFLASLGWESSYFSEFAEKEQVQRWELPHIDSTKLYISSLDVCTSDAHYVVKRNYSQSPSISRPDSLSAAASSTSLRQKVDSIERKETWSSSQSRTNDLTEASEVGSTKPYDSDDTSALLSEFDFDVPNIPLRHIGDESVPDTLTESCYTSRLHYSSAFRARLGMPTFEYGNILAVERFLAVPICYTYMSNSELRSYRQLRCLYPCSMEAAVDEVPLRFMQVERPVVVLPVVPELTSKNIFAEEPYIPIVTPDLRSKLENKEELKKSLDEKRRHRSDRCFFCSYFLNLTDGKVPSLLAVDSDQRNDLLSLLETRYSKDSLQKNHERKILCKYEQCPELFASPCVYWDAFEIISQSRYRNETRRLIHDLFTDSVNLIASHFQKS